VVAGVGGESTTTDEAFNAAEMGGVVAASDAPVPDLSDRRGSISGRSEMEPFDLPSLMAVMVLVCGQAHSVP